MLCFKPSTLQIVQGIINDCVSIRPAKAKAVDRSSSQPAGRPGQSRCGKLDLVSANLCNQNQFTYAHGQVSSYLQAPFASLNPWVQITEERVGGNLSPLEH